MMHFTAYGAPLTIEISRAPTRRNSVYRSPPWTNSIACHGCQSIYSGRTQMKVSTHCTRNNKYLRKAILHMPAEPLPRNTYHVQLGCTLEGVFERHDKRVLHLHDARHSGCETHLAADTCASLPYLCHNGPLGHRALNLFGARPPLLLHNLHACLSR